MTRRSLLLLSICTLCSTQAAAKGGITDQGGELYSIEKRDLMGSHELAVTLGTLPMDAFVKGLTLQASYTYHFTNLYAWEIVGGLYSFNFGTGLEQELKDRFDVQPTELGELQAILNSNFVLKPLYGKLAITNDKVLTGELYFVLGYAHGFYTAARPAGIDFGVGLRMFLGKYFSLRLDIRDYMFMPEFKSVSNNLFLSLGLSLTFGFGEEQKDE
jgi:outer membrane beta-barrel protein